MEECVFFFDRQEIKNAIAYLRLIANRNDDASYERIINVPTRGIGNRTLNIIRCISKNQKLTLWKASLFLLQENKLTNRNIMSIKKFIDLINTLEEETINLPLHIQIDKIIKNSGLWNLYQQKKGENNQIKIENLKELISVTKQFESYEKEDTNLSSLQFFLSNIALKEKKRIY